MSGRACVFPQIHLLYPLKSIDDYSEQEDITNPKVNNTPSLDKHRMKCDLKRKASEKNTQWVKTR
jgi:hypothetical protein